jgi:hypothetical protein
MRLLSFAASAALIVGTAAYAAPCKDAKGKFITCPPPKAAQCKDAKGKFTKCPTVAAKCKDGNGRFAKCGTPGAKPI